MENARPENVALEGYVHLRDVVQIETVLTTSNARLAVVWRVSALEIATVVQMCFAWQVNVFQM